MDYNCSCTVHQWVDEAENEETSSFPAKDTLFFQRIQPPFSASISGQNLCQYTTVPEEMSPISAPVKSFIKTFSSRKREENQTDLQRGVVFFEEKIDEKRDLEIEQQRQWQDLVLSQNISEYVSLLKNRAGVYLAHCRVSKPHSQEAEELQEVSKDLVRVWLLFQKKHISHEQRDDTGTPPNFGSILHALDMWDQEHAHHTGGTKKRFRDFLISFEKYSDIFQIIPAQDKYLSLLTGSISAVVKVYKASIH